MLSKDLTPNPKAVNIVRPSTQRQQQQRNPSLTDSSFSSSSTSSSAFMNLSSSTTSSINTLSTASTYNTLHIFTATNSFSPPKSSPMIRQLSVDSNPGLSFFCQLQPTTATSKQETTTKKSLITSSIYGPTHAPSSASSSSSLIDNDNSNTQKQQDKIKGPLVISRINLANFQHHQQQQQQQQQQRIRVPPPPIVTTAMNDKNNVKVTNEYQATNDELVHKHEDRDDIDIDIDIDVDDDDTTPTATATSATTTSAFKPGFGFLSNSSGGLGSFLLRGNLIAAQKPQVDEARIYRKLKDLEIEKKSLLQLNQTLEMVVKEQSNKISDLQNRLAAIERPLTPALDTQSVCSSKDGLMFSSPVVETLTISDLEQCLEEEDAAFERIRVILSNLIDQAQTAVSQDQKLSGRALMELEHNAEINKYFFTNNFEGKKTTSTTKRRPRSLILPDRASIKATTASLSNNDMRRVSVGSIHNNLPSSPIPNKNYNSSTSNRRLSSVSSTTNATTKDTILHPHHTRPTSRLQHQQDSSQLKKWVN